MGVYLVDSNFFIQADQSFYPIDIVSSFWDKVGELATAGKLISIDKVKAEIYAIDNELKEWCIANLPITFFKDSSVSLAEYRQIVQWANSMSHHYKPSAIQEFLAAGLADSWLVAYARKENLSIVTYEKSQPERKNRIKIPEPCTHFGIRYMDTIGMLRELEERF
jgi:hypothetical protein